MHISNRLVVLARQLTLGVQRVKACFDRRFKNDCFLTRVVCTQVPLPSDRLGLFALIFIQDFKP